MTAQYTPAPAATLRARARTCLSGHWGIAVLALFLAALLGATIGTGISVQFDFKETVDALLPEDDLSLTELFEFFRNILTELRYQFLNEPLRTLSAVAMLLYQALLAALPLYAIHLFVGCCIQVGYAGFRLQLLDGRPADISTLFFPFKKHYFEALCLRMLKGLIILAWSLLFIIPGIIAAYRYAMADYAMAENPDMTPMDALRESARMMRGNKWRLFCLQFSFIGWHLLCLFTLGIGELWLLPYIGQAEAAFYDEASGRAKVREMVGGIEFV